MPDRQVPSRRLEREKSPAVGPTDHHSFARKRPDSWTPDRERTFEPGSFRCGLKPRWTIGTVRISEVSGRSPHYLVQSGGGPFWLPREEAIALSLDQGIIISRLLPAFLHCLQLDVQRSAHRLAEEVDARLRLFPVHRAAADGILDLLAHGLLDGIDRYGRCRLRLFFTLERLMAKKMIGYTIGGRKYVDWAPLGKALEEEFATVERLEIPILDIQVWERGDVAWFAMEI